MSISQPVEWSPTQRERLEFFKVERCVDIHCHLLPGMDDGPPTMDDAVLLAKSLVDDGITTVAATPHQLGHYDRSNSAGIIRAKIRELTSTLKAEGITLEVVPGGDVRIDERLPKLLDSGEVDTLANRGRHLLLELPHDFLIDPLPTIEMLDTRGIQAIITHPERYRYLRGEEQMLTTWVQAGAVIQLTAGSLLGDFGRHAHAQAWGILNAHLASLIATDAHDTQNRPPRLSAAIAALSEQLGTAAAKELCLANPLRVYQGTLIETEFLHKTSDPRRFDE